MKTLKLDKNNNLIIGLSDIQVIDNVEALKQDLRTLLCLNVGENPDNIDEGIDFTNISALGGIDFLLSSIRKRIESHKEVISVLSIVHKMIGDKLIITADVNTIYGNIIL